MPTVSSEVDLVKIVEALQAEFVEVRDFDGLRTLGNFYERAAEKHWHSDVSRWAVLEWFEAAKATYAKALELYKAQSQTQIPGFAEYLEQRVSTVEKMIGYIAPFNYRPGEQRELPVGVGT